MRPQALLQQAEHILRRAGQRRQIVDRRSAGDQPAAVFTEKQRHRRDPRDQYLTQVALDLGALITRRIGLADVDAAFAAMAAGEVARSVVVFD